MKLKTEELRRFLNVAKSIRPNPNFTNLDVIKIQCTGQEIFLTKTNQNIWCQYSYVSQQPAETFLIRESALISIASTSSEFEINIELKKDDNISLISGEAVLKVKQQDSKFFPEMQAAKGEKIKIPKDIVDKIEIAGNYISNEVIKNNFSFVNICPAGIFAFNTFVAFYYKTEGLPQIFFDNEPLSIIQPNDDLFYWQSDNSNFIQSNGFLFCFIKHETKLLPFEDIIKQKSEGAFVINKIDFLNFCTLVQLNKKQKSTLGTFEHSLDNESILVLSYSDPGNGIDINYPISVATKTKIEKYSFSIEQVQLLMKSIPYSQLIFSKIPNGHYVVTSNEDENYKGIITRMMEK